MAQQHVWPRVIRSLTLLQNTSKPTIPPFVAKVLMAWVCPGAEFQVWNGGFQASDLGSSSLGLNPGNVHRPYHAPVHLSPPYVVTSAPQPTTDRLESRTRDLANIPLKVLVNFLTLIPRNVGSLNPNFYLAFNCLQYLTNTKSN